MTKLILIAAIISFLAGSGLWAQSVPSAPTRSQGPAPYGSAEEAPLEFKRSGGEHNVLLFSLAEETAYDDNVLSNNANRRSDISFGISPRIALVQRYERGKVALDYQPTFVLYKNDSGYNAANQSIQFDGQRDVTSRFSLRLRDAAGYATGLFQPRAGEALVPVLTSPSNLNQSVYAPLTRQLQNNARLDLLYKTSRETSIDIFGGVNQRHFLHNTTYSGTLLNTNEENAGAEFVDRLTRTTTLGATYQFQNLHFGNVSRSVVHSGYVSVAKELVHGLTVRVFAGPQYARIRDRVTVSSSPGFAVTTTNTQAKWHATYGGTITERAEKTAIEFSAQHSIRDGGGLLATVTYTDFGAGIKRELAPRWNGEVNLDVARSRALGAAFAGSRLDSQLAGVALEHVFTENVTGRLGYNYLRQRSTGKALFSPDIDRNRVSFTIFYQIRRMAL